MPECPCCSDKLLRHVSRSGVYWFCPYCREEMPSLQAAIDFRKHRKHKK